MGCCNSCYESTEKETTTMYREEHYLKIERRAVDEKEEASTDNGFTRNVRDGRNGKDGRDGRNGNNGLDGRNGLSIEVGADNGRTYYKGKSSNRGGDDVSSVGGPHSTHETNFHTIKARNEDDESNGRFN